MYTLKRPRSDEEVTKRDVQALRTWPEDDRTQPQRASRASWGWRLDSLRCSGEYPSVLPCGEESSAQERDAEDGAPAMAFRIDGSIAARRRSDGSVVTSAEGTVKRFEAAPAPEWAPSGGAIRGRLWLGTPGVAVRETSLSFTLPDWLDLRLLLGRRLTLTRARWLSPEGGIAQIVTARAEDGRVWLVARTGRGRYVVHTIRGRQVYATLSARERGPLVVGTVELQTVAALGTRVNVDVGESKLIVGLVARDHTGCAYVIADRMLCE
jgi:hypothetical protein